MPNGTSAAAPRSGDGRPETDVTIGPAELRGTLVRPSPGFGTVLFAHGSGSSRLSPRNRLVASRLREAGLGTLLFDLLLDEEAADRRNVFDISLLADRLALASDWLRAQEGLGTTPLGYFGASTGAGAALLAETRRRPPVAAVVSRRGRPDLAGEALAGVRAATLLIVGGEDYPVIELNQAAFARLACKKRLEIVSGAGHLFEEAGTLDEVVRLARAWFLTHLTTGAPP